LRTYLRVGAGPIVFVLAVIMGCGCATTQTARIVGAAKVAALSDADESR
jgi:hypothetical protein